MQLDRTLIAVRERNVLDILDLSLHVLRLYARPIAITSLMGVVPLALLNFLLISWIPDFEFDPQSLWRYGWLMLILIYFEAPLAGAFTTTFLGKAVFMQEPDMREVIRDTFRSTVPLIWTHLILRGSLIAWLLMLALDRQGEMQPGIELGFLVILALVVAAIRAFRPYVTEVVLLEKNPLFSRGKKVLTIAGRSSRLHTPSSGDVFGRWFVCSIMGAALSVSICWTMLWFPGVFTNDWTFGPYMMHIGLPLGLWLVTCYFTIVRFLNYLDLRIRQEGWEVELRVRAEAARMNLRTEGDMMRPSLSGRTKQTVGVLLLALSIWAAGGSTVIAQTEQVDAVESAREALASRSDVPWYDEEADALQRIDVDPLNPNPDPSNPNWKTKPKTPRNPNFSWAGAIGQFLFWVFITAIVAMVVILVWFLVKAFLQKEMGIAVQGHASLEDDDHRGDADRIEQLPFKLDRTNRADLLAEARRLYAEGNYREAIIYLFSFQLLLLDRNHLIRLAKGKTNRQYLRETRSLRRIAELLEGVMIPFEDVFFGDHTLEQARFEGCWNALPEFEQLVEKEGVGQ